MRIAVSICEKPVGGSLFVGISRPGAAKKVEVVENRVQWKEYIALV